MPTCKYLQVIELSFYVSQERRSPWLSALEIFDNNGCLLEL